jgi:Negative regulator of sigma F
VLDWSAAGIAAGALSGLTVLAMLELHCPNLKAIHVMVWHVAVVIVSSALGFTMGRIADFFRRPGRTLNHVTCDAKYLQWLVHSRFA